METFLFAFYVLMWPTLSAGTLVLIVGAFARDVLRDRREGKDKKMV